MSHYRIASALSAGMLALCLAASASADSLTGTTIQQTATSSVGTLNASNASASVGSGVTFTNVLSFANDPSLNIQQSFSDTGLTVGFASPSSSLDLVAAPGANPLLTFTYDDSAFTGQYLFGSSTCLGNANGSCDPVSSSDYSTSFSGSTLTVNFFHIQAGQSYTFVPPSSITAAATPEPGSLALTLTGLLGAAGMVRRRFAGPKSA